ncbi:nucleotide pyrophosphohydrolase [bacterium]|jgi:NTP pyrophosphatase (non-canonical NTP hydrolase)|nr:nucleotide pyrophosphohydrolase [bacterium]
MSIDLKSVNKKIIQFRNDRDWEQFHNPKNLAQALSIEAAELQEIFLWKSTEESRNLRQDEIDRVKEELADIFIYMTYICHAFKIDLFNEVLKKIEKNAGKYPIEKSKGSNKKHNQL